MLYIGQISKLDNKLEFIGGNETMEQVMWFFANDDKKVIAKILMGLNEEEKAIDELSLQVHKGRYILGYFNSDGTQKIINHRQIVS